MTDKKPKLALVMIVKNESHIIRETLENVSKYIDYYCINDTGSTDNTKEIIKEYFDSVGIPGEIITHEHRTCTCHGKEYKRYSFFHFGWARTHVLQQCQGKSEYMFMIDADDLIIGDLKFPELTEDCYLLTYGKGFTYRRAQIFKNDASLNWQYKDALHEYPCCNKKNHKQIPIIGDYYVDSRRLGARNLDPMKYFNDSQVFEELLAEKLNDRHAFYCAQSYYDYHDYPNAIKWYKKRIDLNGWYEETFYSYYRVAQAMENLKMPWKEVEQAYLNAFNYCKQRAEPLYNIAKHYRLAGDFQNAYKYARKASHIPYPDRCVLFIYKDMYDYKIQDELSINAYYLGKYFESYSICKKLLSSKVVPENDLERIKQNIEFCENKLKDKNKKICCIYSGDEVVNKDSILYKLLRHITKCYKVIIIGNKIEIYGINNVVVSTTNNFKNLGKFNTDYLIIYNSLNYYYDNIGLIPATTILLQNDSVLKILLNNGMYLGIHNCDQLNSIFTKLNIKKIICTDTKSKNKLINDHKLDSDQLFEFNPTDENDTYMIFDDINNKYTFKTTLENETNGLVYYEPSYIQFIKDNRDVYEFSKQLLLNFYGDIIKQFPTAPEHLYKLASVNIELGEYSTALSNLDSAISLIKNNKLLQNYKDIISIAKAKILTKQEKYSESYQLVDEILRKDTLPESLRVNSENIRDINVDYFKDNLLFYNPNKIKALVKPTNQNGTKKIMLSITTCKRFDLFEKTINSFLNCCADINMIDYWFCVDDNSSQEDRNKMKKQYPFFNYVWKDESQKGHYVSMNIIQKEALKHNCEYLLHMEDDWHFIQKRNYVGESIKILSEDPKFGQVLFNNCYGEVEPCKKRAKGGFLHKTKDGMRYYVHEYYNQGTKEYTDFIERNKGFGTCGYWPHFSFRPSLLRTSMLKDVGSFINTGHFEMQYANEYVARGYKSAFFDTFCSIHTGKKTWEKNGINSYNLNKTGQFTLTDEILTINVFTENKDIEQWKSFKENSIDKLPYYIRHTPTNISSLGGFEKKIFYENTFNYFRSTINYIMKHINLLKDNKSKYMMLLDDRLVLADDFNVHFQSLLSEIKLKNYDIILFDTHESNSEDKFQIIKKQTTLKLESNYGYVISSECIKKIMDYVEMNGIKNVDYLKDISNIDVHVLNKQLYATPQESLSEPSEQFVHLTGYTFYSQMDSFGNDIDFYGKKTVEEYKEICEKENANGFNTLGYIKSSISSEDTFINLPTSKMPCDGLYVKNI